LHNNNALASDCGVGVGVYLEFLQDYRQTQSHILHGFPRLLFKPSHDLLLQNVYVQVFIISNHFSVIVDV
jgi:hypothetical protein